jgi:hypothetical protein
MKHTIWSTDDWLNIYNEYMTDSPALEKSEVYAMAWDENMQHLEDEKVNLKDVRGKNWFAIGTLQRWNGGHRCYRALMPGSIMEAVCEVMKAFAGAENTFEIYVEDGDVFISQLGHDNPTNPSVLRIRQVTDEAMNREGLDLDDVIYKASDEDLERDTFGFGDMVSEIYGWKKEATL